MMTYHETLDAFLSAGSMSETDLATAIGKAQGSVNRYRNKARFPDADTARLIDRATGGKVPFAVWQAEFLARSGIAA
jgi:transcriptional regulator with XRE-family HTH domain